MASVLHLFTLVLVCLHYTAAYPNPKVSNRNLHYGSMKNLHAQVSKEESFDDNLPIDNEGTGQDKEEEESIEQDYTIKNVNSEANLQDDISMFDDGHSAQLMETDDKAVNKEVIKTLKYVDELNEENKGNVSLNNVGQAEDAEFEYLYNVGASVAEKRRTIKKEIEKATRKKMLKKNEEIYKAIMKIGKKIDKIAKKKGVKIPKTKKTAKKNKKKGREEPKKTSAKKYKVSKKKGAEEPKRVGKNKG